MKFGLVGKKLDYSFSKIIHEFLIAEFNIDSTYDLIEMNSFDKNITEQFDGLNVTIPFKQDALELFPNSMLTTCNVIFEEKCYNTDEEGFLFLLDKVDAEYNTAVILGNGAMSKMIASLLNIDVTVIETLNEFSNDMPKGDLLINASPIGMGEYKSYVHEDYLRNFKAVIDLNYNPINSLLKHQCVKAGVQYISGLDMLILQAIRTFEIFTKEKVDLSYVKLIRHLIYKKMNLGIVIIGSTLAGKSTLVRELGGIDIDDKINDEVGDISSLIVDVNNFRKIEHQMFSKYINEKIICLGAGAVTFENNYHLFQDKLVIFLDTKYETLLNRVGLSKRPLIHDVEDFKKLYSSRIDLYKGLSNESLSYEEAREFLDEYFNITRT